MRRQIRFGAVRGRGCVYGRQGEFKQLCFGNNGTHYCHPGYYPHNYHVNQRGGRWGWLSVSVESLGRTNNNKQSIKRARNEALKFIRLTKYYDYNLAKEWEGSVGRLLCCVIITKLLIYNNICYPLDCCCRVGSDRRGWCFWFRTELSRGWAVMKR